MKLNIKKDAYGKVGLNEVVGLKEAMLEAFKPIEAFIGEEAYWERDNTDLVEEAEYKSRDGFIPYSHNHGGLIIGIHVPKCESYSFDFLDFGECDGCNDDCTRCLGADESGNGECLSESEGYLDAYLRIYFKFEGINDQGELEFYLNICGGNGDAPYFRVQHLADVFEASFTCKSLNGLKRAASKHIKAALKAMGAKNK